MYNLHLSAEHNWRQLFEASGALLVLFEPDQRDGKTMVRGMVAAAIVPALGEVPRRGRILLGEVHAVLIRRRIGIGRPGRRARRLRRGSARRRH